MFISPQPGRHTSRHDWAPMTDAEWAALHPHLATDPARGGRPADRRRLWDAVFWVALSRGPWRDLPPTLGNPGTAHRTLLRAARAGAFGGLLHALARRRRNPLASLAYRLLRAFRRICRVAPLRLTLLAAWLGLWTALPCRPDQLPRPGLSKTMIEEMRLLLRPGGFTAERRARLRLLHRLAKGDYRAWRTR